MLVFLALGNAKVLSFALGDAKVPIPNTNDFASQWNIGGKGAYQMIRVKGFQWDMFKFI